MEELDPTVLTQLLGEMENLNFKNDDGLVSKELAESTKDIILVDFQNIDKIKNTEIAPTLTLPLPYVGEIFPVERNGWKRFLGMALMLMACIFFSLVVTVAKALESYQVFSVVFWNLFGGCFLPFVPILIYLQFIKKSNPFESIYPPCKLEQLKTIGFLLIRAFSGCGLIIFQYSALQYLSLSDTTVICFSSPVFVTFLACLLLGETLGMMNILAALVTFLGVVIIARPPFLTGEMEIDANVMTGVGLAMASMAFSTFVYLSLRLLKNVHFSVVTIGFGFVGTIVCFTLSEIFGSFELPRTTWDWFLAFLMNLFTFLAQVLMTAAFQFEDAGPLSLVGSLDVIFVFIWQAIFFSLTPDKYSIIGAIVVLSGVVLIGLRKHVSSLSEDHPLRKTCFCLLL